MGTATQNVSIRIQVLEGDKARKELTLTGEQGQLALQKIREATKPASKELALVNVAGEQLRFGMENLAGGAGNLGFSLMRLGPAGLVAAAAIGTLTLGISASLKEIAHVEQANLKLAAVLRATGSAAGLTKREIDELADSMELSTMRTAEEVKDTASILLTFRSVTGDVFKEALRFAADAQTVFGGDLSSSITRLGKALEDPVEGISALTRVGITFSDAQKEMIRRFVETGDVVKAQQVVLQAFKEQVGGTAGAERQGLTGAAKGLNDAWGELLESIGNTVNKSGAAQSSLFALTDAVRGLRKAIEPTLQEQKSQLEKDIGKLENSFGIRVDKAVLGSAPGLDAKKEELRRVNEALAAEDLQANKEKQEALAAADKKAVRRRNEQLLDIEREFQKKSKEATQTERDKIFEEANEARKRIEANFKDSRNSDAAKSALGAVDENQRARIAKLDAEAAKPVRALAEANEKLVESLQKRADLEKLDGPRQKAIQSELDKLNASATQELKEKVIELAGALYDEQKAAKDATEAQEKHKQAIEQINQGILQTKPSFEAAKQALDEWKEKLIEDLGGATEANEEYVEKLQQIYDVKIRQIYEKAQLDSNKWEDGAARALNRYGAEATDAAKNAETIFSNAASKVEDTLVDMVSSGEFSFKKIGDLIQDIEKDILRAFIRQNVTGPIANALGGILGGGNAPGSSGGGSSGGGIFGSLFSSIFHEGGIVGESPAPRRAMPTQLFAGAPRYHNGLMPDEFPAILQKGETVLPKGIKAGGTNVTFNISTPNAQSFMESQGQIMSKFAGSLQRHRTRNS